MTLQEKRTARKNATVYKYWLEDQTEEPRILAECKYCGEEIELQDGGFMSWTYSNLADHLEVCESAQEDKEFMSKPEGFDEDGNNYPRAKYCETVGK